MDLDFGSDLPEDDQYDAEGGNDIGDDTEQVQLDEEEESVAESNDGDEESAGGATRSMRSSRSPEPMEVDEQEAVEDKPVLQPHAEECTYYDLVPCIAAPQATHINCVVTTKNLRWFFTGGQDGYIRKYDFHQSITGKVPLTVAQKHPFVDSVQRSGVLLSYWENDDNDEDATVLRPTTDKNMSPVYCLAVQSEAMWMLSGQQNGSIKLQTVRIEEGKTVATLKSHTAPVSVLQLMNDEKSLLSGSWDKQIYDWDLETGKTRRNFVAGNEITGQVSTIALRPDNAAAMDFSTIAPVVEPDVKTPAVRTGSPASDISFDPLFDEDDAIPQVTEQPVNGTLEGPVDVFLSSCIDGTMSIWDRRQSNPIARISVPRGVPPWCMSTCWSLDGSSIYCGRRNGTVEEYSMHASLAQPLRTIKLPNNSGPVSSVTAMPNGRSLICASQDNVRLYDLKSDGSGMPFLIVPGHHGGVISSFYVDPSCRYAFSTSGNRGWDGTSTEVLLGYEVLIPADAIK